MKRLISTIMLLLGLLAASETALAAPPADDPTPPAEPVRLIFIHHSTGGNWLADANDGQPYGGLGRALMENNYFVSATNYGWGPDGIGDRTDIPNWPEWFTGPDRDRYLDALFSEGGQNVGDFGDWSRLPTAPGGENVIVMFKSCFPNSDLYGNPGDPPLDAPDGDYTVANAKAVYIDLLTYFETRPDKLFVVITAPPLQRSETARDRAANARAFNNWLVNDWLRDYPLANVAVFDYYNVLTGADNHHRWTGSAIEHVQGTDSDFAAYPSGDSHPSTEGQQKATAEFVPLLNVFYNRWMAGAPAQPVEQPTEGNEAVVEEPVDEEPAGPEPAGPQTGGPRTASFLIDDFEGASALAADGWQPYWDEATTTSISCGPDGTAAHEGAQSLHVDHDVVPGSWATCALFFDEPQDWSGARGLSFYLHAAEPALVFSVDVYRTGAEGAETYLFAVEAPPESADGWIPVEITWDQLLRADWEDGAGMPLGSAAPLEGLAFGFDTYPDTPNAGAIWIDDLRLMGEEEAVPAEPAAATEEPRSAAAEDEGQPTRMPCPSPLGASLAAIVVAGAVRRRR